jgi:acetyl esterase/lipase
MRRLLVGGTAAVGSASRRLIHGPRRPGWTWSEDLLVAVSRAVATTSARDLALMGPGRHAPAPPLSRAARSRLQVEAVDLSGIWAERYCPIECAAGTILRFHGGGFVSGSPRLERRPAAELALATRCDTYGIRYRLAPQHPYPAALNDAITAYRALLDRGTDPDRTVLFGGSAGAGLALAALLEIRRLGLPRPAGGVLLWPYADFTFSGTTIDTNGDVDMLPLRDLAHVWGPAYVGDADPTDPLVSPALADLEGLPPLLIIAGGAECLLSCAEQIAANADAAGIDVRLSVYAEKVHGWMLLPRLPATVAAVDEITTWIADQLERPRSDTATSHG